MNNWTRYLFLLLTLLLVGCSGAARGGTGETDSSTPAAYPMTINAITFQEEPVGLGCPEPLQDATKEQIAASPMNFSLEYLPEAYTLQQEMASTCKNEVVSLGKIYSGPQGVINVVRLTKGITGIPQETPAPIEIAARKGVIFGTPSGTTVILAEPFGMTEVTVDRLERAEVLRIVEGIR